MRCGEARRLFGAYWDDETTQAEREWLESHFTACAPCRADYEGYARSLEWVGALPRVEPAPDLVERTLARTRRATSAPDRIPTGGVQWVPVTAAAALLVTVATLISPWIGLVPATRVAERVERSAPREAMRVAPNTGPTASVHEATPPASATSEQVASAVVDSLFDHSDDVEFILDPVTLRRGRPSVAPNPDGVSGERAVITF